MKFKVPLIKQTGKMSCELSDLEREEERFKVRSFYSFDWLYKR